MAVFNPNDGLGTFVPAFSPSDGGSVLTPGQGSQLMESISTGSPVDRAKWEAEQISKGIVPGLNGQNYDQYITSKGSQSGMDIATKDGSFIGLDWNDPDSVIKKAESLLDTNPELAEMLLNYGMSEKSTLAQYNRSLEASNSTYQRMVKDLQAAGLNPFLAINGMSGSAVSSGSNSYGQSSLSNIKGIKLSTRSAERRTVIAGLSMVLSSILRFGAMMA